MLYRLRVKRPWRSFSERANSVTYLRIAVLPRFATLLNALRNICSTREGWVFLPANVLNLFGREGTGPDIHKQIREFLRTRPDARDLVVHYVGHGDRTKDRKTYFLCLRDTESDAPEATARRSGCSRSRSAATGRSCGSI